MKQSVPSDLGVVEIETVGRREEFHSTGADIADVEREVRGQRSRHTERDGLNVRSLVVRIINGCVLRALRDGNDVERLLVQRKGNGHVREIPERAVSKIRGFVKEARQVSGINVDPGQAVSRQLVSDLIAAADGGFVVPPPAGRPGKAGSGCNVVFVAGPDPLLRILGALPDQNRPRQFTHLRRAARHPGVKTAARVSEDRGIASHQTGSKTLALGAKQKRHAHEVVAHTEVQRKVGRHFPVILHEGVELILVPVANSAVGAFGIIRMEVRLAEIQESSIRGFADFKSLPGVIDGSGERQQQVLRIGDVRGQKSGDLVGNLVDALHGHSPGPAVCMRQDHVRRPPKCVGITKFRAELQRMGALGPAQGFRIRRQGTRVAEVGTVPGAGDHVILEPRRMLHDRSVVDDGHEIPRLLPVPGGMIGGNAVKRRDPAPVTEFIQYRRRERGRELDTEHLRIRDQLTIPPGGPWRQSVVVAIAVFLTPAPGQLMVLIKVVIDLDIELPASESVGIASGACIAGDRTAYPPVHGRV